MRLLDRTDLLGLCIVLKMREAAGDMGDSVCEAFETVGSGAPWITIAGLLHMTSAEDSAAVF